MNGMLKAGLIGLVVGGVFGLGITLLFPYCTPCAALVIGLGVGFLACLWDKPLTSSSGAGLGAKAGAIAGVGHLGGQLLGMALNGLLVGPQGAAEALGQLGLDLPAMDSSTYWIAQIVINGGCGLTNIAVAAGLGALGGLLWYQTQSKNQVL
jgi:hypothetical protein